MRRTDKSEDNLYCPEDSCRILVPALFCVAGTRYRDTRNVVCDGTDMAA